MFREIRLHLGVFALLLGSTYLLVRLHWIDADALYTVVPLFLVYIGLYWIWTSIRWQSTARKGENNDKE